MRISDEYLDLLVHIFVVGAKNSGIPPVFDVDIHHDQIKSGLSNVLASFPPLMIDPRYEDDLK